MTKKSEASRDGIALLGIEKCRESAAHPSGAILKASAIAPRDIIDPLPEALLKWLHEDLDRASSSVGIVRRTSELDFEAIFVDRLFPLRDTRHFVQRLRCHSQATAIAAGMIAESFGGVSKVASVCGWLHDLGVAACIRHVDEVSYLSDDAALAQLWSTVARSSAQHGIRLASRWRLPSSIRHAIRDHANSLALGSENRTAATTLLAEHVAAIVGYDFHEPVAELALGRATSLLNCCERELMSIATRTERLMGERNIVVASLLASKGA